MSLEKSITILKGIGEKKAKLFNRLRIYTINDLIHYYPRGYEKNGEIVDVENIVVGEVNLVKGRIVQEGNNIRKGRLLITSTVIEDDSGKLMVSWFNQGYLKNSLLVGDEIYLKGKVVKKYNRLTMSSPKILKETDVEISSDYEKLPVYFLTKAISNKVLAGAILQALEMTKGQLKDFLPNDIKGKYELCDINYALLNIHQPESDEDLGIATRRLIFDEFFMFQMGLQFIREKQKVSINEFMFEKDDYVEKILEDLPFSLTNAQRKVWGEIKSDLKHEKIMNRLVQGDVGSGKTIIAALGIALAANNGYQSGMMAPTEVLAKQHFESLVNVLSPLGIEVELLVGSMTKKEKVIAYERIVTGKAQVIVGTHALIQEGLVFHNLALVITDEQHRFGVNQRETFSQKGLDPHILVMSATPIPRTLALIVYGDMDVSVIDELPPGRTPIKTYSVTSDYRKRIYSFICDEINKGRQCYIVCPMVEENEDLDLESVISYANELKNQMPTAIRIQYLHGKMKAGEKNRIMDSFNRHEIDLLVSTTVIEVGVNVPNASIMVIENAERFGLAQLHQLRGRVGRGKYESHCILITDAKTSVAKKRMEVMKESNDGFKISEYDLKLRGPGDLLGLKQHGLPDFRIGNVFEDIDLLKSANEAVRWVIENKGNLEEREVQDLYKKVERYFEESTKSLAL